MASSSSYCFIVVSMTVLLQLLLVSASSLTSTKYIDAICERVNNKTFCVQTLNAYPPAVFATGKDGINEVIKKGAISFGGSQAPSYFESPWFQVAKAVLRLSKSYALKSASFIKKAAKDKPYLKKQFKACQDAYVNVVMSLKSAALELKESPESANYDVMVCTDSTTRVKDLVGRNSDLASKTVMRMVLKMEKLLAIAVGATEAVGG